MYRGEVLGGRKIDTYSINSGNKSKAGFPATLIQGGMKLTFESVCAQPQQSSKNRWSPLVDSLPHVEAHVEARVEAHVQAR